ncbi:MAG TPA: DUF2267 domain-containing protein [Methylocella sp.]|nr:DUF2267 domain-containing protein [Methylocella sp.]
MEELIARIAAAGIDPAAAEKAVGIILAFLKKEGPKEEIDQLFAAMPGAAEAAAAAEAPGGLLGSMGGLMGVASRLSGLGLGMGEMQAIGAQFFAYAREHAGDEAIGQVVQSIPGLKQFL